VCVEEA